MQEIPIGVFVNLLTEFLIVIFGVAFVNRWKAWRQEQRYGRWHVFLLDEDGKELLDRPISPRKAEEVLTDEADLNVYLKGLISPFGVVKCDLVTRLREGVTEVIAKDDEARRLTIRVVPPDILPTANVPRAAAEAAAASEGAPL